MTFVYQGASVRCRTSLLIAAVLSICSLAPTLAQAEPVTGKASYYSHSGRTASGAAFNRNAMTTAHRTAPFGTKLRVTNLANKRTTIVTVTDRGPFIRGRIIDVSARAADVLGFRHAGVARVLVETAY